MTYIKCDALLALSEIKSANVCIRRINVSNLDTELAHRLSLAMQKLITKGKVSRQLFIYNIFVLCEFLSFTKK